VGGARKCDGQLLTALVAGSWTSESRCVDVGKLTQKLGKSQILYIRVYKCISCNCMIHRCLTRVGILCDLLTARPDRYNNHAPTGTTGTVNNLPDLLWVPTGNSRLYVIGL